MTVTVNPGPPTAAPGDVRATAGDGEITVSGDPLRQATTTGGVRIEDVSYPATATEVGNDANVRTCNASLHAILNTLVVCTITGLSNGVEYSVTMQAQTIYGRGPKSPARQATPRPSVLSAPRARKVPADFAFKPDGIGLGESFRLLFVTSATTIATYDDISIYNDIVQTSAASGHAEIRRFSNGFRALVSTDAVDARDNVATNLEKDPPDPDAPIYWMGGNIVADGYFMFHDENNVWSSSGNPRNNNGVNYIYTGVHSDRYVWTGSFTPGTAATRGQCLGCPAGFPRFRTVGELRRLGTEWSRVRYKSNADSPSTPSPRS